MFVDLDNQVARGTLVDRPPGNTQRQLLRKTPASGIPVPTRLTSCPGKLRIIQMTARKVAQLPWTKKASSEDHSVAYLDERLKVPVIHEAVFVQMLRLEHRRT